MRAPIVFDVPVPFVTGFDAVQLYEQVAFLDFGAGTINLSSPSFPLVLDPAF